MASIVTTSIPLAAPAASGSPFPVLLLSPGFAAAVSNYTLFAEELASHGYVVVVIGHTGMNAVVLPDRGLLNPHDGFWHDWPVAENREMSLEERKIKLQAALDNFARDQLFVLEQLHRLNESEGWELAGKLDMARVASMGHSAGYLAPLGLMLTSQSIQAYCFFDVTLDEPPAPPEAASILSTPTLLVRMEYARPPQTSFTEQIQGPFYDVSFQGLSHASVTDFPYLSSLQPPDSEIKQKAIQDIRLASKYTLSFLETFLSATRQSEASWLPEEHEAVVIQQLTKPHI